MADDSVGWIMTLDLTAKVNNAQIMAGIQAAKKRSIRNSLLSGATNYRKELHVVVASFGRVFGRLGGPAAPPALQKLWDFAYDYEAFLQERAFKCQRVD